MKTRILTSVMMVFLTTGLFAAAANSEKRDSTTVMAYTSPVHTHIEYVPVYAGFANSYFISNANLLENWVNSRDEWEEESPETETVDAGFENAGLGEWITGRELWEQASDPASSTMTRISLDEWIAGRDTWEQK